MGWPKGKTHSAEARAKISTARKAAWADPEARAKMSAAFKAAWADPEVRAERLAALKASQQASGHALNPEQLAQIKAQIEAGASAAKIAKDWLIHPNYPYGLAKKLGVRFKSRRAATGADA